MSKKRGSRHQREVRDLALSYGYTVERTAGGHLALRRPGWPSLFTSKTPSDWRTLKNLRGQLSRARPLEGSASCP